jgi:hypothetical protein
MYAIGHPPPACSGRCGKIRGCDLRWRGWLRVNYSVIKSDAFATTNRKSKSVFGVIRVCDGSATTSLTYRDHGDTNEGGSNDLLRRQERKKKKGWKFPCRSSRLVLWCLVLSIFGV